MSYYRQGPIRPPGSGMIGVPGVTPYVRMLIIVNGAVWILQVLLNFARFRLGGLRFEQLFGLVPDLVIRGFVWQLGTYMFLHAPEQILHILFNMLMLWMFGGDLERRWGSRAFLRYYLVCGVGGGVFITLTGQLGGQSAGTTIGASGAVFGIIVAFGVIFAERPVLFALIFPMKARTMAMILFALTFFYTFTGTGGNVSHIGHLGGAVVGFLYLKRAWRVGSLWRELRWKLRRRRFRVMPPNDRDDSDRWVN